MNRTRKIIVLVEKPLMIATQQLVIGASVVAERTLIFEDIGLSGAWT